MTDEFEHAKNNANEPLHLYTFIELMPTVRRGLLMTMLQFR